MTTQQHTNAVTHARTTVDRARLSHAFIWGVLATLAMSALMLAGVVTHLSPMPKPIPVAIVGHILGPRTPMPFVLVVAVGLHLAYGGLLASGLAAVVRPITVLAAVGLGITLWVLMGIAWLPFIGWGLFGLQITPAIAGATLILHLVYGLTLGLVADRQAAPDRPAPEFSAVHRG